MRSSAACPAGGDGGAACAGADADSDDDVAPLRRGRSRSFDSKAPVLLTLLSAHGCSSLASPGQAARHAFASVFPKHRDGVTWTELLARPGEVEARSLLSQLTDTDVADAAGAADLDDTDDGPWWAKVFQAHGFPANGFNADGDATLDDHAEVAERDKLAVEKETWRRVKETLGSDANAGVVKAAKQASKLLSAWSQTTARGPEHVSRGVQSVAYLMQTPFGGDGACVAAALLCEAHESSDGLLLDDESMDAEWVKLLVSLSNLSQLYRLQHARWDAEGESLWGGGSFDPDGEDTPEAAPLVYADGDDEHRLFAHRLPSTHADNLQHMLVAIASDFRALPLLLVRRLRALRDEIATAAAAEPDAAEKPSSLARDALDVLAPLAERFGLYKLKSDLEDAAFERLAPATRRRILGHLDVRRDERHVVLEDVSMRLRRLLKEDDVLQNGVASLRVSVREKEPYSVWRKQHVAKKRRTADDGEALDEGATPLDTIAFRVVLDPDAPAEAEALCYHALKLVQQTWQPIKDRTKDYVANPKPNGYQSIHTTSLMRLHGQTYPFEVQIRTRSMHLVAEFGSAAHALYSKGKDEDVKDGAAAAAAAPALAEVAPVSGFAWPTVPGVSRAAPAVSLEAMQLQAADDSLWSRRLDVRLKRRHADGHDSALGASLGASLGAKLRSERVFVLARGGRVLTVASQSDAFDVRRALMNDLEMDAGRRGAGYAAQHRNYGGHLAINGRRVEWLQSLETKLLNGDEISWSS